jgi:type IV pilus assembly protein PilV
MPVRPIRRGFTLVEVLVALVVLALGLLGVGKLFVVTIRGNASATSRLAAVNLAADLGDRIRANRTAGSAYAGSSNDYGCIGGAIKAIQCTSAQMAATDLAQWQSQIAHTWPSGASGTVTYVSGGTGLPATYTITVAWREAGTGQTLSYTVRVVI